MWLVSFQGLNVPFLPFNVNPNYEGLLTFWTYVIILQVSFLLFNFFFVCLITLNYEKKIVLGYDSSIAVCYNRIK